MKPTIDISNLSLHMARTLPRLLSQLCRDEDNPLFGCFDRHFWHYKMRDFPSMVLQQGVCVLDLLSNQDLVFSNAPLTPQKLEKWKIGALRFWAKFQHPNGSFDEYYPNESGFPPTSFSLYSAVLASRKDELETEVADAMQKACRFILKAPERRATNQEIIGLAGCSIAKSFGIKVNSQSLEKRWDEALSSQSSEGWFNEYDGADTGYLSVTCDALYDYYDATGDQRALLAIERAAKYLHHFLTVADDVPAMINSRNTDYIVPYGLARLGKTDPFASSVVQRVSQGVEKPRHFLNHIDDRYLVHYVYTSWFRSLKHLEGLTKPEESPTGLSWFPKAKIFILHSSNESSIHVAAGKGGVTLRTNSDGTREGDLGWRGHLGRVLTTTHWQEPLATVSHKSHGSAHVIRTNMPLMKHSFLVPTVLKHICLRILSLSLGKRLIPLLKKILIFKNSKLPINFVRIVTIKDCTIEIADQFEGPSHVKWHPAGWSSMRHVASAAAFSFTEAQIPSHTNRFIKTTKHVDS